MIGAVVVAGVAFVAMEPVTYLVHRFVMHGIGRRLHRSHHRRWPARSADEPFLEANDAFPVIFAGLTMAALAVGFNVDGFAVLLPVCVGATLYGAAYAFVHDAWIHGRVRVPPWAGPGGRHLARLAAAHDLHHRFGGEPYGMLLPVVPSGVRDRAARAAHHSPSGERIATVPRP